jgi:hypothetical protein
MSYRCKSQRIRQTLGLRNATQTRSPSLLPAQLRGLIRSNQKLLYDLLLRHSARPGDIRKTCALNRVCWPCFRPGPATRRGFDPIRFAQSAVGCRPCAH